MVLHATTSAILFFTPASPVPVVVQLVQKSEPESWLKWLLPTVVQTVVSLASIAAGVLIAWRSFLATSERDHARWALDQKRAEWRELLIVFYEIGKDHFPPYKGEETAQELVSNLQHIQRRLSSLPMQFIFIAQPVSNVERAIEEFVRSSKKTAEEIEYVLLTGKIRRLKLQDAYEGLRNTYLHLVRTARGRAEKDLGIYQRVGKDGFIMEGFD